MGLSIPEGRFFLLELREVLGISHCVAFPQAHPASSDPCSVAPMVPRKALLSLALVLGL